VWERPPSYDPANADEKAAMVATNVPDAMALAAYEHVARSWSLTFCGMIRYASD